MGGNEVCTLKVDVRVQVYRCFTLTLCTKQGEKLCVTGTVAIATFDSDGQRLLLFANQAGNGGHVNPGTHLHLTLRCTVLVCVL